MTQTSKKYSINKEQIKIYFISRTLLDFSTVFQSDINKWVSFLFKIFPIKQIFHYFYFQLMYFPIGYFQINICPKDLALQFFHKDLFSNEIFFISILINIRIFYNCRTFQIYTYFCCAVFWSLFNIYIAIKIKKPIFLS